MALSFPNTVTPRFSSSRSGAAVACAVSRTRRFTLGLLRLGTMPARYGPATTVEHLGLPVDRSGAGGGLARAIHGAYIAVFGAITAIFYRRSPRWTLARPAVWAASICAAFIGGFP